MTKFCTKCGKKLAEGQKCTCEKIKRETKTFENTKEIYEKSDLIKIIESFLNKPIDTLSNLKNYHFNSYILLIIASLMTSLVSSLFRIRGFHYNVVAASILSFITLFILISVIYLLFSSNKKIEFNDILELTAVSSISLTFGFMISFLISFISLFFSLIFIILTILLFIIYLYHGLILNINFDKNKVGYLFMASIILSIFILMLLISII